MNWKCFFGHKWNNLKCERCGKTRDTIDVLIESPYFKCSVCYISGRRIQEELDAMLKSMGGAVGIIGGYGRDMLFCKKCKSFVCTKCTLQGEDKTFAMPRCPHCFTSFGYDSLAYKTENPQELLELAKKPS